MRLERESEPTYRIYQDSGEIDWSNPIFDLSGIARVPLPDHDRMVVSAFGVPRQSESALEELARHDSVEDAAVAHAVTLEPPEVDFINRAIGD